MSLFGGKGELLWGSRGRRICNSNAGVELQKGAGCVVVESKQGKSPEQKDTQGSKRHTHTHQSIGRD